MPVCRTDNCVTTRPHSETGLCCLQNVEWRRNKQCVRRTLSDSTKLFETYSNSTSQTAAAIETMGSRSNMLGHRNIEQTVMLSAKPSKTE